VKSLIRRRLGKAADDLGTALLANTLLGDYSAERVNEGRKSPTLLLIYKKLPPVFRDLYVYS